MTAEPVQHFADATVATIVADRARVPLRVDPDTDARLAIHEAVAGELRPLVYQVAEMAEREPDNVQAVVEYLHGRLEHEPMRSNPAWEPHRVVLGLLALGLANALAAVGAITAEQRAALRPAYLRDADAAVTAAFDDTYIPPADEPDQLAEEPVTSDPTAPETTTDADLLALF